MYIENADELSNGDLCDKLADRIGVNGYELCKFLEQGTLADKLKFESFLSNNQKFTTEQFENFLNKLQK